MGAGGSVGPTLSALDDSVEVFNRQALHLFQRQSLRAIRQRLNGLVYKSGTVVSACHCDLSSGA